jgi:hypothetical protein
MLKFNFTDRPEANKTKTPLIPIALKNAAVARIDFKRKEIESMKKENLTNL